MFLINSTGIILFINNYRDIYTGFTYENEKLNFSNDKNDQNYRSFNESVYKMLDNHEAIILKIKEYQDGIKFSKNSIYNSSLKEKYYLYDSDLCKYLIPSNIDPNTIQNFCYPFIYTDNCVYFIDKDKFKLYCKKDIKYTLEVVFTYNKYNKSIGRILQYDDTNSIIISSILKYNAPVFKQYKNYKLYKFGNVKELKCNSIITNNNKIIYICNESIIKKSIEDNNFIGYLYDKPIYNNIKLENNVELTNIDNCLYYDFIDKEYYLKLCMKYKHINLNNLYVPEIYYSASLECLKSQTEPDYTNYNKNYSLKFLSPICINEDLDLEDISINLTRKDIISNTIYCFKQILSDSKNENTDIIDINKIKKFKEDFSISKANDLAIYSLSNIYNTNLIKSIVKYVYTEDFSSTQEFISLVLKNLNELEEVD